MRHRKFVCHPTPYETQGAARLYMQSTTVLRVIRKNPGSTIPVKSCSSESELMVPWEENPDLIPRCANYTTLAVREGKCQR
ncbi:hypothetical protein OG21DRAFT_1516044 [Imleria badia]|nr:hypothetical protein OG21DRAFT_1516044 [Imleria badia]